MNHEIVSDTSIRSLCDKIRQTAYEIHTYHRHGHLEKVYENALAHRLRRQGLRVHQQHPVAVYDDDGTLLGEYFADLFVEESLIIELKATKTILPEHEAQILGYLISAKIKDGLLINFCSYTFQIKKYVF